MRGFDHETILSPSFHGVRKERLAQWPPIFDPKTTKKSGGDFQKNWVGMCRTLPETLTLFQTKICDFPYRQVNRHIGRYPISDRKPWSLARDRSGWQAVTARTRLVAAHTHIDYIRDYPPPPYPPPGRKTLCRLWVSLLTQARLKNL